MEIPAYSELEANELLNAAISIAEKFLVAQGGFPPFCLAVTVSGERVNSIPDVTHTQDPAALTELLRQEIRAACSQLRYRCIAFTRNTVVVSPAGTEMPSIQITIEQLGPKHVTCYLPYTLGPQQQFLPGQLYATKPVESFYPDEPPRRGA